MMDAQSVLTAAVEAGHATALLPPATAALADAWLKVVRFNPVYQKPDGELLDAKGQKVSKWACNDDATCSTF